MEKETYVNSGTIRSLLPVLNSWIDVVNRYTEYFSYKDAPWWYNERATLSSLAAAAWTAGKIALEEYSTQKGRKADPRKGRCDLYIGIGEQDFACEAKHVWCNVGSSAKSGYITAKSGLTRACTDARDLDREEGRRLGICFAVPYVTANDKIIIDDQLGNWLVKIQNIDHSCIAWVFPKKIRHLSSDGGYFHPGVVLLIKEVSR